MVGCCPVQWSVCSNIPGPCSLTASSTQSPKWWQPKVFPDIAKCQMSPGRGGNKFPQAENHWNSVTKNCLIRSDCFTPVSSLHIWLVRIMCWKEFRRNWEKIFPLIPTSHPFLSFRRQVPYVWFKYPLENMSFVVQVHVFNKWNSAINTQQPMF